MKCGECNLFMPDWACWRDGARCGYTEECRWTLAQQGRWYRRNADYSTAPMAEHIRMRREKEAAA